MSRLLYPETGRGKIDRLLMAAGQAAAFMPRLEVMEIWNGGEGHACVFRYSSDPRAPQITWASTWGINVQLDHNVVRCWADVPRHGQHPHGHLVAEVTRLPRKRKQVKTHATAIGYLKLRPRVLNLISEYQLFWEERAQSTN